MPVGFFEKYWEENVKRSLKIVVALLVIIAGTAFFLSKKKEKTAEAGSERVINSAGQEQVLMPVKTTVVRRGEFLLGFKATGEVCARQQSTVRFPVAGIVEEILISEGDQIRQGQVLIRLQSPELINSLKQAENRRLEAYSKYLSQFKMLQEQSNGLNTELEQLKKDYENALDEFRHGRVTRSVLEEKESKFLERFIMQGALQVEIQKTVSGLSQAETELMNTRLNFEKLTLRAPFSGTIARLSVARGERVNNEQEAVRIVDPSSFYVRAFVLESELARLKIGADVRLKFISFPEMVYSGKVSRIIPEIDTQKRMVAVIVEVEEKKGLLAGLKAELEIAAEKVDNVLLVPREAILVRSGRPLIFIVKKGLAIWKYITIRAMGEKDCWIEAEEVQENDQVIIEGHLALAHQTPVQIEQ